MYKWYTFFLLVALRSDSPLVNSASISKRQVDLINLENPEITNAEHVGSTHEPEEGKTRDIVSSQLKSDGTESQNFDLDVQIENLEHEWWKILTVSAKRLGKAFEMYDEANATWKGDLRALAEDVKLFKLAFDTEYILYQQKIEELELNYIS